MSATTEKTHNGVLNQQVYDFPFIIDSEDELYVQVDGVLKTNPTDYTVNGSNVTFATAPWTDSNLSAPLIRIYRETNIQEPHATYYPGSAVKAVDLNENHEQVLWAVQELKNYTLSRYADTDSSGEANKMRTDVEMSGFNIKGLDNSHDDVDLASTTEDTWAASKGWVKNFFFDVKAETRTRAEYLSGVDDTSGASVTPWPLDDAHVATTYATHQRIEDRLDSALVNDIHADNGIRIDDNTNASGNYELGDIRIGINAGSTNTGIAVDRINEEDIVDSTEQQNIQNAQAGSDPNLGAGADNFYKGADKDRQIATIGALAKRFDAIIADDTPATANYQHGKMWFAPAKDHMLSIYSSVNNAWLPITSGGTFTTQPTLIWVDAFNGNDLNDGHRIIDAKRTIKAAVTDANDGDMIYVLPGVYRETLPIDFNEGNRHRRNVSVIGMSMRSVFVHPTPATENNDMWLCGSGTFLFNMTWAGCKVQGTPTRDANEDLTGITYGLDGDPTYGLPQYQNWYVKLRDGLKYTKSPYVQNVTAFGDSRTDNRTQAEATGISVTINGVTINDSTWEIVNNTDIFFKDIGSDETNQQYEDGSPKQGSTLTITDGTNTTQYSVTTEEGSNQWAIGFAVDTSAVYFDSRDLKAGVNEPSAYAGDINSSPTVGAMLVDGNTPHADSPLRSIVSNAYTFITLDGPGALVTNGGYAQLVSTFGTFCHYHAKALNGGMANLSNCVTDFGRFGLIADGYSSSSIFTSNTVGASTSSTIVSTAGLTAWRAQTNPVPADHMLVRIGNDATYYPILEVTRNGSNYNIKLASNPGNISDATQLTFYLRSIITSGSHVFEFCGSGTDYSDHPDRGGIPVKANQVIERNNGRVYYSSTDHNGHFEVGDVFTVSADELIAKYNGTALTELLTSASNVNRGTLDDARLPAASTTGAVAYPTNVTISPGGRVTSATAGTPVSGLDLTSSTTTSGSAVSSFSVILKDTANNDSSRFVKLIPSSNITFEVNGDELSISAPASNIASVSTYSNGPSAPYPQNGDGTMFWDEKTGESYIFYNDGDSQQWVQFAPQQRGTGNGTVTSVIAGTGLSGGTITQSGTIALSDSGVTAGTYGGSATVPAITVDAKGRLTSVTDTSITGLAASTITSGTLSNDRLPVLDTTKVPNLDASKITSGTFTTNRIPDLSSDYLTDVSADTSPTLGGNLATGGFDILGHNNSSPLLIGSGGQTVNFVANDGVKFKKAGQNTFVHLKVGTTSDTTYILPDLVQNKFLKCTSTNGTLQWTDPPDPTYTFTAADYSDGVNFNLYKDGNSQSTIQLKEGNNVTITETSANVIEFSATGVPTGCIMWWPVLAIPYGWLVCDGTEYTNTQVVTLSGWSSGVSCAALAAVLGTGSTGIYNAINTANTNFKVPNLTGKFIRGLNDGQIGFDNGRGLGNTQLDQLQIHQHKYAYSDRPQSAMGSTDNNSYASTNTITGTTQAGDQTQLDNIDGRYADYADKGTGKDETRPVNMAMIPIIKM